MSGVGVQVPVQDYKPIHAPVMIYATRVNRPTHLHIRTDSFDWLYTIYLLPQPAELTIVVFRGKTNVGGDGSPRSASRGRQSPRCVGPEGKDSRVQRIMLVQTFPVLRA